MKKFITIEWDDELGVKEEHSKGLTTWELIGILETMKLHLWGSKQIVND